MDSIVSIINSLSFSYNFSNSFERIPTVRGGHDSRTFLCVAGIGAILIDTVNSDSVDTIHITIVCTAVSCYAAISSRKRVDGAQATTTLE